MTCIVAVKTPAGVWMGADSILVSGWNSEVQAFPKIKYLGTSFLGVVLIGFSGSPRAKQYYPLVSECDKDARLGRLGWVETFADLWRKKLAENGAVKISEGLQSFDGAALVSVANEIFKIDSNFYVSHTDCDYRACGIGEDYALGALFATPKMAAKKRVEVALRAAAQHNVGVREPFRIYHSEDYEVGE